MRLKTKNCFLRSAFVLLLTGIATLGFSQTIRGRVLDASTGEPLAGATVHLEGTHYSTLANLDGSYIFRNIRPGKYGIEISLEGYKKPKILQVEVAGSDTRVADLQLENTVTSLTEVIVATDGNKTNDKNARFIEKNSDVVQNVLSAKTIQLLPDVTVANALQRVSGVSIQRDNTGDGRYAIIRGMDQRYNTTLVNGIKIPSPDDKYRFVPMNIFPSEMLERLEVIKALTPNMEGDAIGGTMNLVMKSAPDNFLLSANASGGYSTLFSTQKFSAFNHSGINKQSPAQINGNNYTATPADFPLGNLNFNNKANPVNSTLGLTVRPFSQ